MSVEIKRCPEPPTPDRRYPLGLPLEGEKSVTEEATRILEDFFRSFSAKTEPLLLLDYDGTLAPFRVDRSRARPYTGVREALARIQNNGRTRIVVISGRPAKEVAPLLRGNPPVLKEPVEVWGLHGAERMFTDGRREVEQAPASTQRKLDELRDYLRHNNLGGEFEDKPNAAVMHWRGASPRTAKFIEVRTRELFEPLAKLEGLMLLEFEGGLELRVGRDKGAAVATLASEAPPGAPVAYLGDDITDEAAFKALNQLDRPHLSVLMRPEPRETAAGLWLKPPSGLRAFLKKWNRALAAVAA
ncbi:trehalose-phosphatase [Acidobacteria bacterium AB60]|nr:trehalose-phosphatase [Acidobacteria bacterium AB60]